MTANTSLAEQDLGMKLGTMVPGVRTPAQIEASRRNGARSHGPVSPFGKSISRKNALKHGLVSSVIRPLDTVLMSSKDFDALRQNLIAEYEPESQTELLLVESLAVNTIRLRIALEMDIAQHKIPAATEHSHEHLRWSSEEMAKVEREIALLETAINALTKGIPFPFCPDDANAVITSMRELADAGGTEATRCQAFTGRLLEKHPQESDGPGMGADFQTYCLLHDLFGNKLPPQDLVGLRPILVGIVDTRNRDLADAKKAADMIATGREMYFSHRSNAVAPNADALMRYEGHIRKMIEKDLKLLFALKQVHHRPECAMTVPIAAPVIMEE